MGWGGCLADDMGLGKTLQALSFLRYVVERYPDETHLVVCPTSLLYNWESEMKKFVPDLEHFLYYGSSRALSSEVFRRVRVVLTSYGVLRSDVGELAALKWGYVILDESQAIKNPLSQARKAVQQLQSRNRMALSGTPVQNSTFDLYAQMDFLNQGMLGEPIFSGHSLRRRWTAMGIRRRRSGCGSWYIRLCCGGPRSRWRGICRTGRR